ncbi:MAG: hypothetical protein EBR93_04920 [Bacteroidetes bacterium]|nr:hypothetical protein [Bacteroidota bacterium]
MTIVRQGTGDVQSIVKAGWKELFLIKLVFEIVLIIRNERNSLAKCIGVFNRESVEACLKYTTLTRTTGIAFPLFYHKGAGWIGMETEFACQKISSCYFGDGGYATAKRLKHVGLEK